ncbi:MAG TPA: SMC family ATPase [Ktedonobacterales bacterium]|nr:SMC family ATPase [Ktedonobacterales bacterium]
MRITSVELTNIKSYRHAAIPFDKGATAIRGRNGAGKSTLVEAIGFALFDALPYKQAQFVREGERVGVVAVTFLSALDEREYQVVRKCGGVTEWYAYDPAIGTRIAEQKVDVYAFLRQHLRIEGEVELPALFNDALGVPQGSLTADFLETGANRKKKFDALLQVEEYRKAAEKLNDTRQHLQLQQKDQQRVIADLERETGQLPTWRATRIALIERDQELTAALKRIERETQEVGARHEALRRQETELSQAKGAAQVAGAERNAAEAHYGAISQRIEEAREASYICSETAPAHKAHLATETGLAESRQRAQARDVVLRRQAETAQRLAVARQHQEHARSSLAEAVEAGERVVALAADAQRQTELEARREITQRDVDRLTETQRQQQKLQAEEAQAEQDARQAQEKIAALDALAAEAALLGERQAAYNAMLQDRSASAEREKRLAAIRDDRERTEAQRERAVADETRAQENVRKLLDQQAVMDELPALEARHTELESEIRLIDTNIAAQQRSRQQSSTGLCPFLDEPCLNIQKRGQNSLVTYFDGLISADQVRLKPLRARLEDVSFALERARQVQKYFVKLPEYQELATRNATLRAECDERLAALEVERQEIRSALNAAPGEAATQRARQAWERSDRADRQRAVLPELHAALERVSARRETLQRDRAQLEDLLASLRAAPETLAATEEALRQLGDPRGESKRFALIAGERTAREAQFRKASEAVAALESEAQQHERALAPYAGLDNEIAMLEQRLEAAREGHLRYLRYERLAAGLTQVEQALEAANRARTAAIAAHEKAIAACNALSQRFDAGALEAASARLAALNTERGSATEGLAQAQRERAALEAEIARVEGLIGALDEARAELATLEELERMLQQFRETIKEAGPNILKAVLHAISTEANRIFGEILGDRSSVLSWEQDYEIVLRRDGRERSFAQLSGGEQMSAALAVRLALLRGLSRLDMAFFDEPTQNMDGERRGNLAEQIRRVRGFEQLVVISHDDTFEQGLDSVIHLDKRNGETVLLEDDAFALA